MIPSDRCLALIREAEGVRYKPYDDIGGKATIGVGHLLTEDELATGTLVINGAPICYRDGLTEAEVDALFTQDIQHICDGVRRCVDTELTQGQFDALVSFMFNIGEGRFKSSTMCRLINSGDFSGAVDQFKLWINSNGKPVSGLIRRRRAEAKLFKGD